MKKSIFVPFVILCLFCVFYSCGELGQLTYSVSLYNVEGPSDAKQQFGENKIVYVNDNNLTKYSFEDDYIKIIWYTGSTQFNFQLFNKTGHSLKLPWDEMAYVDENGSSRRVIHSGIKYMDRNNAQTVSIVPKSATITDYLLPSDNVYYVSIDDWGKWNIRNLLPEYETMDEISASGILGKSVRVVFPIVIENVTNEYNFEFKIDSAFFKPVFDSYN